MKSSGLKCTRAWNQCRGRELEAFEFFTGKEMMAVAAMLCMRKRQGPRVTPGFSLSKWLGGRAIGWAQARQGQNLVGALVPMELKMGMRVLFSKSKVFEMPGHLGSKGDPRQEAVGCSYLELIHGV